jgi:hypothetical protein
MKLAELSLPKNGNIWKSKSVSLKETVRTKILETSKE